jgi:uncharacterized protein
MYASIVNNLSAVRPDHWNRLAGGNPFLQHEFLTALERTSCVGDDTGWRPVHVVLHADGVGRGPLCGAVPLYLKYHSYGEYVFDWSWADAYARSGHSYYPKLVAAVPFTPATGRRLLVADGVARVHVEQRLVEGTREVADRYDVSSLHWLFHSSEELSPLSADGGLTRVGCQFHWSNRGYRDFEDFLSTFKSDKRNSIRRERRRVREAGVQLEVLPGGEINSDQWDLFNRFYRATISAHGGIPYLTREFFHALGETMADRVLLVVARQQREVVAMALNLRDGNILYGRYWGGRSDIRDLHFETCYYTPIEYCIAQGITLYEAGAQGEHKIARGFAPVRTYSSHWLRDARLRRAVADFLVREQHHVGYYIDELNEHSPFRRGMQSDRRG